MKEVKNIVTNLKLSKKLKEKGFSQEGGLYYWNQNFYFAGFGYEGNKKPTKKEIKERQLKKTYRWCKKGEWIEPVWEVERNSIHIVYGKGLIGAGIVSSEKDRKKNMKEYIAERKRAVSFRALTVEELLEDLIKNRICFELVWHDQKALIRKVWGYKCPIIIKSFENYKFADTLALLWIYLVDKKLLKEIIVKERDKNN